LKIIVSLIIWQIAELLFVYLILKKIEESHFCAGNDNESTFNSQFWVLFIWMKIVFQWYLSFVKYFETENHIYVDPILISAKSHPYILFVIIVPHYFSKAGNHPNKQTNQCQYQQSHLQTTLPCRALITEFKNEHTLYFYNFVFPNKQLPFHLQQK
jgi:hypothetical protein